jgi:ferredoxin
MSMKKVKKVKIDQSLCIGAGTCVVLDPKGFMLDSENKAVYKDPNDERITYIEYEFPIAREDIELWQAAEGCPVMAIYLYDEDGEQIYP